MFVEKHRVSIKQSLFPCFAFFSLVLDYKIKVRKKVKECDDGAHAVDISGRFESPKYIRYPSRPAEVREFQSHPGQSQSEKADYYKNV